MDNKKWKVSEVSGVLIMSNGETTITLVVNKCNSTIEIVLTMIAPNNLVKIEHIKIQAVNAKLLINIFTDFLLRNGLASDLELQEALQESGLIWK